MDKKGDLKKIHEAEMHETAKDGALYVLTPDQVRAAQSKYASLRAEYLACSGIYAGFHEAGFEEKANPFAMAATIAEESVRAAGQILDILGIRHPKT